MLEVYNTIVDDYLADIIIKPHPEGGFRILRPSGRVICGQVSQKIAQLLGGLRDGDIIIAEIVDDDEINYDFARAAEIEEILAAVGPDLKKSAREALERDLTALQQPSVSSSASIGAVLVEDVS